MYIYVFDNRQRYEDLIFQHHEDLNYGGKWVLLLSSTIENLLLFTPWIHSSSAKQKYLTAQKFVSSRRKYELSFCYKIPELYILFMHEIGFKLSANFLAQSRSIRVTRTIVKDNFIIA